jgi:hypothetical protein
LAIRFCTGFRLSALADFMRSTRPGRFAGSAAAAYPSATIPHSAPPTTPMATATSNAKNIFIP